MTKRLPTEERALPCVTLPYSSALVGMLQETLAELDSEPGFAGATQRYWDICRGRIVAKAAKKTTTRTRKKAAGDAA